MTRRQKKDQDRRTIKDRNFTNYRSSREWEEARQRIEMAVRCGGGRRVIRKRIGGEE